MATLLKQPNQEAADLSLDFRNQVLHRSTQDKLINQHLHTIRELEGKSEVSQQQVMHGVDQRRVQNDLSVEEMVDLENHCKLRSELYVDERMDVNEETELLEAAIYENNNLTEAMRCEDQEHEAKLEEPIRVLDRKIESIQLIIFGKMKTYSIYKL